MVDHIVHLPGVFNIKHPPTDVLLWKIIVGHPWAIDENAAFPLSQDWQSSLKLKLKISPKIFEKMQIPMYKIASSGTISAVHLKSWQPRGRIPKPVRHFSSSKLLFAITLTLNNHPHSQNQHQTRTKIIEHPGGYSFMIFWNKICQFWESDFPMQTVEGFRHGGRAGYYYEI